MLGGDELLRYRHESQNQTYRVDNMVMSAHCCGIEVLSARVLRHSSGGIGTVARENYKRGTRCVAFFTTILTILSNKSKT